MNENVITTTKGVLLFQAEKNNWNKTKKNNRITENSLEMGERNGNGTIHMHFSF